MRDGEKVDQACRYPGIEPIKNRSIRVMMAWPIPTNLQVASTHPERRRWILSFQSGLEGRIGSEVWTDRKAQRLLEMNKVLRKDRSGSVMLLRDLKDLLKDTIRMIPQTRIISHLDDDKDEEEDYDEMILEEDEEQRRKE
ncbi:hypothetical protein PPACK8108_LOCUS7609 [Phakopsora pachyrhizi]|uniref:Uncharacterized protein n=1 Tax=Phakopsora pachyrhizi TaxID=170000 RepID=A0AAV0AV31_PHAPC|nr:hypothetical protein PPACK8108_LOCUS7609 [Phakopsora pachyrhizi]